MGKYRDRGEMVMWNSKAWLEQFGLARESRDWGLSSELRRAVFEHTKKVVQEGGYEIDGSWVAIGQSPASTWFCDELKVQREGSYETVFEVVNEDCLATARRLAGENPLVLNMASRSTPGGGVERVALERRKSACLGHRIITRRCIRYARLRTLWIGILVGFIRRRLPFLGGLRLRGIRF